MTLRRDCMTEEAKGRITCENCDFNHEGNCENPNSLCPNSQWVEDMSKMNWIKKTLRRIFGIEEESPIKNPLFVKGDPTEKFQRIIDKINVKQVIPVIMRIANELQVKHHLNEREKIFCVYSMSHNLFFRACDFLKSTILKPSHFQDFKDTLIEAINELI